MASFKQLTNGKWQARVAKRGTRKSKSFARKANAAAWAADLERELDAVDHKGFKTSLGLSILNLLT